ncbi:MAG: hypothetical protein ACR2GB_06860 [Nocardioidaceae bacterium]
MVSHSEPTGELGAELAPCADNINAATVQAVIEQLLSVIFTSRL